MINTPTRTNENFLIFGSPLIGDSEIEEVRQCLKSGWLGTGPKVALFEEKFKKYKKSPHAVAVNSCTAALHLSLLAANLRSGDEVITTALTFCATVNAIIHAGCRPVLVDVNPRTMNIDPTQLKKAISPRTKALIPVHFAGRSCDMEAISLIASRHNLKIIEDCAHAIETTFKGQPVGTFGDFGCFSFYVTKNIVTGEGGMILAKNEADVNKLKILALHGMSRDAWQRFSDHGYKHYFVVECGFKYNMMDIQAAIGIHQLEKIETYWLRRLEIWNTYMDAFSDLPVVLPADSEEGNRHAYHLFTIQVGEDESGMSRDNFLEAMTIENIGVGVHYLSIPEHPYYQQTYGWRPDDYPAARDIGRKTVSLPLSAKLSDDDVADVIKAVRKILRK